MKLLVAGSRQIKNTPEVLLCIMEAGVDLNCVSEIVSGCAAGVDTCAIRIGTELKIPVKKFPADWGEYGRSAGFIRNAEMADYSDTLVAVWDGKSRGTKHMIDTMLKLEKKVYVFVKGEIQ